MDNIVEFATLPTPERYRPLLRELLIYDATCENCCVIDRNELGLFHLPRQPSPLHWSRQIEWPWAIEAAELNGEHVCLDVGGGWSVLKYAIANRSKMVVSIDADEPSVLAAERTTKVMGFPNVTHLVRDGRGLEFPDDCFDRVFCVSVLEHVKERRLDLLREAARVLKPGGAMLLTMDVAFDGGRSDDFYLGVDDAGEVLGLLGLPAPDRNPERQLLGANVDGVSVVVMMIRWVKPQGASA